MNAVVISQVEADQRYLKTGLTWQEFYETEGPAAEFTMYEKLGLAQEKLNDLELVAYFQMLGFQHDGDDDDLEYRVFYHPNNTTLIVMDPMYPSDLLRHVNLYTGDKQKAIDDGYLFVEGSNYIEMVHPEELSKCALKEERLVPALAQTLDKSAVFSERYPELRGFHSQEFYEDMFGSFPKYSRKGESFVEKEEYFKLYSTYANMSVHSEINYEIPVGDGQYGCIPYSSFLQLKAAYLAGCFRRTDGTLIESTLELPEVSVQALKRNIAAYIVPELQQLGTSDENSRPTVESTIEGLMQKGGLTVSYGLWGVGKTADVMRTLYLAANDTLVFYLAFEDAGSLKARTTVLKEAFGERQYFFPLDASGWDLCQENDWNKINDRIDSLIELHDPEKVKHVIVCIDNLTTGMRTEDQITKGPNTVRRHIGKFRGKTGFGVWLIAHEKSRGAIFGADFLKQDADIVTRITPVSGKVHTFSHHRVKGRNCESDVKLHEFSLLFVGGAVRSFVAGDDEEDVAPTSVKIPMFGVAEDFVIRATSMADRDGQIAAEELRQVLDEMLSTEPGDTSSAARQRRTRLKKTLIEDGVLYQDGSRLVVGP